MKITPDIHEFIRLSSKANLIPVTSEIMADLETPVSCFLKLRSKSPNAFLLESVEGGLLQGRYSFIGTDPETIIESVNGKTTITSKLRSRVDKSTSDPMNVLKKVLAEYRPLQMKGLPRFAGGAVGFVSYDMNRCFESRIPEPKKSLERYPDLYFMIADSIVVFDHVSRKIIIVVNAYIPKGAKTKEKKRIYASAETKIADIERRLRSPGILYKNEKSKMPKKREIKSNFSKQRFINAVKEIKKHIRKGDVIQTVLSQKFSQKISCSSFDIYRALRSINPSPYMFHLNCGEFSLVGSSPETHVRCEDGILTLKPIAGTRPRGKTEAEDVRLSKDLLRDPKERAEHVMLVDLGRNDLGRVSKVGSVKVSEFMAIERYSHVMHIVSQLTGELLKTRDLFDVIRATFPAGTVSGAPKVRSMEIIHKLEPEPRGPYAGLVGYLSYNGNFDSCITIRTMIVKDDVATVQAGAGIVADSVPKKEWTETKNKAKGLFKAIEMAERGFV